MTTSEFNILLNDPGKLNDLSYTTLNTLLLQSPYCNGIHMLLLKKYKIDKHTLYERHLGLASMHASDRGKLYDFLSSSTTSTKNKVLPIAKPIASEEKKTNLATKLISPPPVFVHKVSENPPVYIVPNYSETVDCNITPSVSESDTEDLSLSSMPIEEWLKDFEPPRIVQKKKPILNKKSFKLSRVPLFDNNIFDFLDKETGDNVTNKKAGKKVKNSEVEIENENSDTTKTKLGIDENVLPLPKKQHSDIDETKTDDVFDLFLSKTCDFLKSINDREKDEKENVETWEDGSTDENEDIASETLADLLAFQGQKDKAIKMYRTLSLKFPKKSRYFAEKIEELS
ncbi:hypothetical protein OAK19_02630 [Aureispira]|nr:hypothetical protein [Aureispira sp.]